MMTLGELSYQDPTVSSFPPLIATTYSLVGVAGTPVPIIPGGTVLISRPSSPAAFTQVSPGYLQYLGTEVLKWYHLAFSMSVTSTQPSAVLEFQVSVGAVGVFTPVPGSAFYQEVTNQVTAVGVAMHKVIFLSEDDTVSVWVASDSTTTIGVYNLNIVCVGDMDM